MKFMSAQRSVLWLILFIAAYFPLAIFSAEIGKKEIDDVPEAEKIKWARATKVLITDAIKTATAHTSGQVIEASLHTINGRLLYEIEVVTKDGKVVELFVDPQNGKLVRMGESTK